MRCSPGTPVRDRLARYTHIDRLTGCHLWTGGQNSDGYGTIVIERKTFSTHRVAYELARGPVLPGLHLDHLCRRRHCLNPDHLEPVTQQENIRRGLNGTPKTHCPHGHLMAEENVILIGGKGRACRECMRITARATYRLRGRTDSGSCSICGKAQTGLRRHFKRMHPTASFNEPAELETA